MALPLSKSKIDRLGDRLRRASASDAADLALLQDVVVAHQGPKDEVAAQLRALGFQPTSRLKTWQTTVDKLKREKARLSQIQDIAGVRLTVEGGLFEQDNVAGQIMATWPTARVVDRRQHPSHGYRAVHVIVSAQDCPVEIQIRTHLQNAWAQVVEKLGDRFGRGLRYGEVPPGLDDDNVSLIGSMVDLSEQFYQFELSEQLLAMTERSELRPDGAISDGQTIGELAADARVFVTEVRDRIRSLEASLTRLAAALEQPGGQRAK